MMYLFRSFLLMQLSLVAFAQLESPESIKFEDGEDISEWFVPEFSLQDLSSGQRTDELLDILTTTGLFAVVQKEGDSHYSAMKSGFDMDFGTARSLALSGLCQCTTTNSAAFLQLKGADSILLKDGMTTRTTIATATAGHTPLPLDHNIPQVCGQDTAQAMDTLRDYVDVVSKAFVQALDKLLAVPLPPASFPRALKRDASYLMKSAEGWSYNTVSSIVQSATNLEHFHVYHKEGDDKGFGPLTREWHADAGLFLTFVPAEDCFHTDRDASFYVQDAQGRPHRAVFPSNAVVIMLGMGAEQWLHVKGLRATRHAVQMPAGHSRAWYGMMHLVPQHALVQTMPPRTFADMRQAMVLTSDRSVSRTFGDSQPHGDEDLSEEVLSLGCGAVPSSMLAESAATATGRRRRLQMVDDGSVCNNATNFYCWMSCLDIPDASKAQGYINEGYSLYCVDPSVLVSSGNNVSVAVQPCESQGVPGKAMNTACMGSWQPTAAGVPSQQVIIPNSNSSAAYNQVEVAFCYGATSMYMDGFNWKGTACAIYLFPSWVLDSRLKLVFACLGTILFGMLLELVIHQRRRALTAMADCPGQKRLWLSASYYGLQLTLGYSLMLVVMIYSVPLFLSVIVGIVGGHVLFNAPDAIFSDRRKAEPKSAETTTESDDGETARPESCCAPAGRNGWEPPIVPEGSTPCCQNTL